MGLAVGDVLGAPFEFWKAEKIQEYLLNKELEVMTFRMGERVFPRGFYTDDTAQMICLAESLIESGFSVQDQFERYRRWLVEGYATPDGKSYGVGQQTLRQLLGGKLGKFDGSNEKAGGNGSLMRCTPVALLYCGDYGEIREKSILSNYVTHNNLIAGWSCVLLNTIVSLCLEGVPKDMLLKKAEALISKAPEEIRALTRINYEEVDKGDLEISGYSFNTITIALWGFFTTKNFESCIDRVIRLGNDTDTFGAVSGSLAGSHYGYSKIPKKWSQNVINAERIQDLAKKLIEN